MLNMSILSLLHLVRLRWNYNDSVTSIMIFPRASLRKPTLVSLFRELHTDTDCTGTSAIWNLQWLNNSYFIVSNRCLLAFSSPHAEYYIKPGCSEGCRQLYKHPGGKFEHSGKSQPLGVLSILKTYAIFRH